MSREFWRMAVFFAGFFLFYGGMNYYVYRHFSGLPVFAQPRARWWLRGILLGVALVFPLSHSHERGPGSWREPLEIAGNAWLGVLLLLLICFFAVDLITAFGHFFSEARTGLRVAAILLAVFGSAAAVVQALRPPAVIEETVALRGLPKERDGLVLVQLTDLHLGPFLNSGWWRARVAQVASLKPDVVVLTGDLVDHNRRLIEPLVPELKSLTAPLGVYAVTGNHEFYAGVEGSVRLMESAGFKVLRDRSVEVVPGLVFSGVDDLTARRQLGLPDHWLEKVLGRRPPGATVLLSHSPLLAEDAAQLGVGLMLSGHTHDGQIWPFRYLVQLAYPHISGRYEVRGMSLIVSRGTGFWGPPMRLFHRSEIHRIVLKAA